MEGGEVMGLGVVVTCKVGAGIMSKHGQKLNPCVSTLAQVAGNSRDEE